MPKFHVEGNVDVHEISRSMFLAVMERHMQVGKLLEHMPAVPDSHECRHCPIDPHTVRFVVKLLSRMRNAQLEHAVDVSVNDTVQSLIAFSAVNTIDAMIASVCGEFAPDLGMKLLENYK